MRTDARPSCLRVVVADYRAAAAARTPQAEERPTLRATSSGADWHSVHSANGHSMGDVSGADGMRIRRDLLAAPAGLAGRRNLGPSASRTAESAARRRPDRLQPGLHGQLVHRSQKGSAATGPNPTDRGRPGTKRHLITGRRSTTACPSRSCSTQSRPSRASAAAAAQAGQAARRQGLRPSALPPRPPPSPDQAAHCTTRHRKPPEARSEQMGRGTQLRLVQQVPQAHHSIRTQAGHHHAFTSIACAMICLRALKGRF